jgi:hypothetical protein
VIEVRETRSDDVLPPRVVRSHLFNKRSNVIDMGRERAG